MGSRLSGYAAAGEIIVIEESRVGIIPAVGDAVTHENGLPAKWSYDGVHLNIDGYKVAEAIILEALKR